METLGGSKASPDQREYSAGVGGGVAGRGLNMFGLLWQSTSDWAAKQRKLISHGSGDWEVLNQEL